MKAGFALDLLTEVKELGGMAFPFKLYFAELALALEEATKGITKAKQDKFLEHVLKDETGKPLFTDVVQKAIEAKKIQPSSKMPFEAFRFKTPEDKELFEEYTNKIKDEEVDFVMKPLLLKDKVFIAGSGDIRIRDFLNSPNCQLSTEFIMSMLSKGVFK